MNNKGCRQDHRVQSVDRQRPPQSHIHPAQELWDVQRAVILLTTQLHNEQAALDTWMLRLRRRQQWEHDHGGESQLPALRHCAAETQLRIQDLAQKLAQAQGELRRLEARKRAREGTHLLG